ncbi:MAG: 30S ribosomal protein S17 [archaeon]|nr:30S ribosomal protein S17 [archaeon]
MSEKKQENPVSNGYSVRGSIFTGKVVSAKAPKTVTIERKTTQYIRKFERYKKSKSKISAHVPQGMEIKEGDIIKIGETRKISKTKSFVVLEIVKKGEQ